MATPEGRPVSAAEVLARPVHHEVVVLGRSVENRKIACRVLGSVRETVLLIATIHGNESAGTPLLHDLAEYLKTKPELLRGRRVVVVPLVNPDGYQRRSRYNAHQVDLNRNFPAHNRKSRKRYGASALSEPESRAIAAAIARYRPGRIISIHQPRACVDYDGPAEDLAKLIGALGDLKVRHLGSRPGSLGAYAGETLGIPTITLELPGRASRMDSEALWRRFGPMLIAAVVCKTGRA
jgi:protein MpaA